MTRAVALLGIALVVRLLYWAVLTPRWVPVSDADQYVELARSLASGRGFAMRYPSTAVHATAFRPPLLPVLLAPGAALGRHILWPIRLTGAAIGAAVAPVGASLAARVARGRWAAYAAWSAGLALAVSPQLVVNDTVALTEGLAVVVMLGALVAALDDRPALAGALVGAMVLARPNAYLVAIVVAVLVGRLTAGRAPAWRRGLACFGMAAAVVLPWVVRNGLVVGAWRPATSDGYNLAAIYSTQARTNGRFTDPALDASFDDPAIRFTQLDEARWQATMTRLGLDGIREHPGYALDVARRNAVGYFELRPAVNRWAEDADGRNWGFRTWVGLPWFYATSVLGVLGWWWHRAHPVTWAVAVIAAQFVVVSLLLIGAPRVRAPVDALSCVGVGLASAHLVARWRGECGGGVAADGDGGVPSGVHGGQVATAPARGNGVEEPRR